MTKQTKIIIASVAFLLVSFLDVYAVIFQNKPLEILFKPLLMIALVIVYLVSTKRPNFWLISALFFSFWGDVFLLDKQNYFIFGLGSFLIAHFMYIKMTFNFLKKCTFLEFIKGAFLFVVFFLGVLWLIKGNLKEMLVPVIVYGLAISTFGSLAFINFLKEKSTANNWLFLGAIIFIASDSLIALNNFYQAKELFNIVIIILYILSQYLIVKAVIAKENTIKAKEC